MRYCLIVLLLFIGCVSSEIPTKSSDKTVVIGAPAHTPAGWVGFCTRNPKDPACRETFPQFFESYCKSNPTDPECWACDEGGCKVK